MRWLTTAASVVALSVVLAGAHDPAFPIRKSLGFGPTHPRTSFKSNPNDIPYYNEALLSPTTEEPFAVASSFVEVLLALDNQLSERSSFVLRTDSYTDDATGVTHAYFRQIINGLEVADGDINVNVKDGVVISYGDSVCNIGFRASVER